MIRSTHHKGLGSRVRGLDATVAELSAKRYPLNAKATGRSV